MFDNRVEDEGAERVGGIGITELTEGTGVDGKAEFGDVVGPELFDPPPAATPATAPATAAPAAAPAASPAPTLIPAAPFTPAAAPAAPVSAFPESSLPGPASLGGPVDFGVSMLFEKEEADVNMDVTVVESIEVDVMDVESMLLGMEVIDELGGIHLLQTLAMSNRTSPSGPMFMVRFAVGLASGGAMVELVGSFAPVFVPLVTSVPSPTSVTLAMTESVALFTMNGRGDFGFMASTPPMPATAAALATSS